MCGTLEQTVSKPAMENTHFFADLLITTFTTNIYKIGSNQSVRLMVYISFSHSMMAQHVLPYSLNVSESIHTDLHPPAHMNYCSLQLYSCCQAVLQYIVVLCTVKIVSGIHDCTQSSYKCSAHKVFLLRKLAVFSRSPFCSH